MAEAGFFLAVVLSLFAIVDPIGALPFFVGLTQGFDVADRQVILRRSVVVAGGVLAAFALAGRFMFAAFGFTLAAFEIAGGILLFLVAYDMLHGEVTRTKLNPADREEALARRDELSVVPLGIPLLAGPGAISTVMIYEGYAGSDVVATAGIFAAITLIVTVTFFTFRFGATIFQYLGRVGIMAVTRVMGLILAAVAVQFVLNGVVASLPFV